jgi:hypothetical protein
MDPLAQSHYEIKFELEFRKASSDAFQNLFGRVMNLAYPGDFTQTKPWGVLGDEKCDGYLRSQRRFFQCYGPTNATKSTALSKIDADFKGALRHAARFFDSWVLAHNFADGRIPTWLLVKLDSLKEDHRPLQLEHFGFVELRNVVFSLSNRDLIHLLGPAPTQQAMVSLGLRELQPILAHLQQSLPVEDEVRAVSGDKLNYNELPSSVETLLKAGMTKARILEKYFARTHNKEKGIRVAAAFRNEYSKLKSEGHGSVEIFDHLRSFAAGPYRITSEAEVGTLAIVAYLFEACDIFENPFDNQ